MIKAILDVSDNIFVLKLLIYTFQGAGVIHGTHTDIICKEFDDKLFIVLTQYQRLGTLVSM